MAKKFRLPNEIQSNKFKRVPIAARISEKTKVKLERAAKKLRTPIPLANLIEAILDDYVDYLEEKGEL